MGLLECLMPPSIFNVSQTRLLDNEQGAQLEPQFRPALLVVDMQEDFCPPNGSLAVAGGRSITPLINTLLTSPLLVLRVATKDWHPPNHISFASNHQHSSPETSTCCPESIGTPAIPFVSTTTIHNPHNPSESYTTRLWPPHCIAGSPGAALIPELDVSKIDKILEKGTDPRVEMYSAFYDPFVSPRVSDSGLADMLREAKVTHVYVVGLAADYCVWSTAMDAHKEGFETVVVEEATRAVDEEAWRGVKERLVAEGKEGGIGVKVVSWQGEEVGCLFPGGLTPKGASVGGEDVVEEKI
ncbi:Isochorismatase-like protein [Pseudoneurospora amorphoporcata]|uniref:nicotinamidase n=1 Tax=Pseudoneurospora amorphoporcata TaxID=241081 RepID=A0AAN6NWJ9_9PEZI|nr:Isochorismatase-like protein [Pseudoneurospora amorphoporcata]